MKPRDNTEWDHLVVSSSPLRSHPLTISTTNSGPLDLQRLTSRPTTVNPLSPCYFVPSPLALCGLIISLKNCRLLAL